jgi:hypothetical protein
MPVSTAALASGLNTPSQGEESLAFLDDKVTRAVAGDAAKFFDPPAPGGIRGHAALVEGVVQRGLEDAEVAVGRGAAAAKLLFIQVSFRAT